ncbi:hypothetical protein KBJ98_07620 [Flavobacterium sp. F-328]|uniref:GLPGLI family protein n=1 Tax=Flavobacterium erciyesense TaxID=2825842 RepID=A0ABS5D3H4_9FLAO|nr:hypothetical protein [Flavobacterium erciyesense]MBQ0908568.1 hypothetical protein [Flavobacterium erciyesense]
MKKSILIIVILIYQNVLCQSFTFDRFIEYKDNMGRTSIFMINSKNSSYHFFGSSFTNEISGSVFDTNKNIRHHYSLKNVANAVQFDYIDSSFEKPNKIPCYDNKNIIEVKEKQLDSASTNFKVLKFKNSKKKKAIQSSNIKAIKSGIPVFSLIIKPFFGHFIFCKKIELPENYLPTIVEIDYFNGIKTNTELIQNKEVNVLLSLNKQDIKLRN